MKKIYLKKITAIVISAVMMICGADLSAAAASYFTGSVTTDDPGISVAGISIDVYSSVLRYSANGLKRYEHTYRKTVKTDSSGNFRFARPSGKTLLKVVLDTLPAGTGVNERTRLVSSKYDDTFRVSRVAGIRIDNAADGSTFSVNLTAADGSPLFADYTVSDSVTTSAADISYDTLNSVRLDRTVTACAAGLCNSKTFQLDISHYTVSGKLSQLIAYGIIDEDTREELLDEYAEDTASVEDPRPDFISERRYTTGGFMLHSEQGTQNVSQYESILRDIVDVYFRKYGFLEPYHEFADESGTKRDDYFHIYLVDPDVIRIDSEVSPKNVVGQTMKIDTEDPTKGCYIVLSPADALNFKWALAHEMFHCIMYRYIGKNQAVWFKESFANYGSLLCISETTKSLNKQMSYYLDSTEFSLSKSSFYRNRHYGLFLLPLYIHSKFGGADTIKNILKAYAKTTSAYKAIDNGLRATKSSYSFAVMFAGFKDVNAYTVYYRMPGSSKGLATSGTRKNATRTILTSFDKYDTSVTPAMTLGGSSAAYFEYRAPSSSSGKLTVTVETLSGSTDASYNMVIKGKSITIPARRQTSGLVTFVLTGLGGSVSAAVLTAGNTSMASSDEVSFLATAYFEES